ncbi:MAG: OmpA family protein [Bacteroidota bacterium]|nr:OmpA family protein [Bacteroidota bacterium]MDP4234462.1 OmpA family protein [Bacteroidota bacterium]MDP4243956.1 OmpA family protein [Bacteroidota bacterium]MDP4288194.1 OmpA family protein [Bacteroidota bacterium]
MRVSLAALAAIFSLLASGLLLAQQPSSDVLKLARAGFDYEQQGEYRLAIFEYDTAIKLDPKYPYPYERIGAIYQRVKNYPLAISYYSRAIQLDSSFDVYNYFNLGPCYRILEKHDSAIIALKEFLHRIQPVNHYDTVSMKDADWWIKFNLGCIIEKAKPKNTGEPVKLSEISSSFDDFAPSVTADGQVLFFTSRRAGTNAKQEIETGDFGEDLFVSHKDTSGRWGPAAPLPPPLNSIDDEGAATISADGQTMYISLCRRPDGAGDCDIYKSDLVGSEWTKPINMGRSINSPLWDAQPSVTADGQTMYFSSRRMGSMDSSEDIYVTYRNTDGSWIPPKNLGEPVNTRFNECSPFISADGRTLYFSSNGHPGFGNMDLFMSRRLDDGTWSVPVNLGEPINSYGDDEFLTIPASGDKIIYSSQRKNARGPLNLFQAVLPPQFRPGPVTLVAGTVYDRVTDHPVGARVEVNDLKTDQLVAVYRANRVTGKFYIALGTGKLYGITALADGYVHFSDSVQVPDTISYREVTHDLPLTPLPETIAANQGKGQENANEPGAQNGKLQPGNEQPGKIETGKQPGKTLPGKQLPGKQKPGKAQPGKEQPGKQQPGKVAVPGAIDTGSGIAIQLNNIFFDFNKSDLRPESHTELRYLIEMLKQQPKYRIEIDGHTDSVGTVAYNKKLSEARAQSVRTYLVSQGIAANRLVARGFGATRPIASNATEEGRSKNRRTEFRFIKS